ncbi:MAG TPA: decaprenyl-phosphate phosphoribosyltransferase [Chloroflexi bacterium]|nr:decaprenyl-phosphate phosphoribosyltransferase [Chloroflexota bacterium]
MKTAFYLLQTMRPKQWVKNGLLFAALFFDRKFHPKYLGDVLVTVGGFIVFCMLASTVYLVNDLSDLEADRQHPRKKYRPLPAGKLPPATARIAALILPLLALPAAWSLDPDRGFFIIALLYLFGNLAYSRWLKHIPLLDVLLLAGFYVLRVGAGVSLITVTRFSPWLYLFTTFLALYLGIGKRRAELSAMAENGGRTRRVLEGYTLPFLDQLLMLDSAMALMTYSLYTFSAPNLPENHAMMLTIPFVLYGVFRYLYLVQVRGVGEAPEEVLFEDRPMQLAIALWGFSVLLIFYIF